MKLKEKLITALSSVPLIAATTMSGACAAGCPYGRTCAYPGHCSRYTDSGGDGVCDLSVSSTSSNANTETASSSSSSSDGDSSSTSTGNSQTSTSTNDQSDTKGASDPVNTTPDADTNASTANDQGTGMDTGSVPGDDVNNYFLFPVSILLVLAYLFTHYLFNKGILKQGTHRRIWNLLLIAGYLGTGITGVLLVLLINMGIRSVLNQSITFWHVELSILMFVGTLIHIHLYRKPFKNIFKVLLGFKAKERGSKTVKSKGISK